MASSDYDTYSRLHCRSVYTSEDGLRLANNSDDTKTITVKATPTQAGNVDITLPTSAGALLSDQSTLSAAKLDINGATAETSLANDDELMVYDASATANRKVTMANLKTFVDAAAGLPAATEAQVLIADSNGDYASQSLSGDVAVNASGAVTIQAGAVENAMLAGSIEDSKLNQITTADKVAGSAVTLATASPGIENAGGGLRVAFSANFPGILADAGGLYTINYTSKNPVDVCTAAALPAYTQSGSKNTGVLTADSNGALTVDGVAMQVSWRVLVKNAVNAAHNGPYVVTAAGDESNPWVLTRASDMNANKEAKLYSYFHVVLGDANKNKCFVLTTVSADLDVGNITFQEMSLGAGTSLEIASGNMGVSDGGIDTTQLADDAVEEAKIADSAVTNAKLAGSIATAKLADAPATAGTAEASKLVQLDGSKDLVGLNETEQVIANIGGANKWRVVVDGSNNLVFQQWNSSSWVVGHTISSVI